MPTPVSFTEMCKRVVTAVTGLVFDGDEDFAGFGELDGISDEIDQHLANAPRVTEQCRGNVRLNFVIECQALLLGAKTERLHGFRQYFMQIERDRFEVQLTGFNFGEVQNVVDEEGWA